MPFSAFRFSAHFADAATMDADRLLGGGAEPLPFELAILEFDDDESEDAVEGTRSNVFSFLSISPAVGGALSGAVTTTALGIFLTTDSLRRGAGIFAESCFWGEVSLLAGGETSLASVFSSPLTSSRILVSVDSTLTVLSRLSRSHSL